MMHAASQVLIGARFELVRRRPYTPRRRRPWHVRRAVARAAARDRRRQAQAAVSARHLQHYERCVYSQNGEDGVIGEVMRRLGPGSRTFVEIGTGDGSENCTRALLEQGWSGIWIEADPAHVARAREVAARRPLRVVESSVDRDNVTNLLRAAGADPEPDVFALDIDGIDWWVLRALFADGFRPRLAVVEYNAWLGSRAHWRLPYDPAHRWDGRRPVAASLAAWTRLASGFGYVLVGCDSMGVNAFFVRREDGGEFDALSRHEHHVFSQHVIGRRRWGRPRPIGSRPVAQDGTLTLELDRIWRGDAAPGQPLHVTAWVTNGSDTLIGSPGEHAVRLAWRWDGDRSEPPRALNTPWRLGPGQRGLLGCRVILPPGHGEHQLELALVQEGVRWFDGPGRMSLPISVIPTESRARQPGRPRPAR